MNEEKHVEKMMEVKRILNSLEHKLYVTFKFTRTTEILLEIIKSLVKAYTFFFDAVVQLYFKGDKDSMFPLSEKIKIVKEIFSKNNIEINLNEYLLLKKFLVSDFERIGEYRKNLKLILFLDGEEHTITIHDLLNYFNNLKNLSQNVLDIETTFLINK